MHNTRIAGRTGEMFGLWLIAFGVLNVLAGNFIGGMWLFLIGLFVRGASAASYYQLMMRCASEGEPIRRFITPELVTISRAPTARQFVEDYVYKYHHDMFPVAEDSRPLGCVTVRQAKDVPKDRWDQVTVGEIVKPYGSDNTIDANEDALKALSISFCLVSAVIVAQYLRHQRTE